MANVTGFKYCLVLFTISQTSGSKTFQSKFTKVCNTYSFKRNSGAAEISPFLSFFYVAFMQYFCLSQPIIILVNQNKAKQK